MSTTVRRATAEEQAAIVALVRGAKLNPSNLRWPGFVVAERDGRIVGVAQLRRHVDGAVELASLVVEPAARGGGVATSMIDTLIAGEKTTIYAIIDGRYIDHFGRWGFSQITPAELPRSVARVYRIGRVVTALASLLRRDRIRLVAIRRSVTGEGDRIAPADPSLG